MEGRYSRHRPLNPWEGGEIRTRRSNMRQILIRSAAVMASLTVLTSYAQTPGEQMADLVKRAFSLVGRWEIVKMHVLRASDVSNPSTIPETSMGQVTILVESQLGSFGHFDIASGGAIAGQGQAQYQYRVAAGTTAFSWGPVNLPIGAVAMMHQDDGVRKFSITGQADLAARTIKLNSFKAEGGPLKMIVRPGGSPFTVPTWPPMTNVEADVLVHGSSLLLRASGMLSGIKVSFEAVKYVDLMPLFMAFETMAGAGPRGTPGAPSAAGGTGGGTAGEGTGGRSVGPQALFAGTINVPVGGTVSVAFRSPMSSAGYAVSLTMMDGLAAGTSVTFLDKTPRGFKVHAAKQDSSSASASVKVDWVVTPYTN